VSYMSMPEERKLPQLAGLRPTTVRMRINSCSIAAWLASGHRTPTPCHRLTAKLLMLALSVLTGIDPGSGGLRG
jgi:hypothetical protein